jgi:hypothetical protein
VRPYDGPYPKKSGDWRKGYIIGDGTIAIPNEAASWEDELVVWPEWNQADSQNIPFFLIVPANAEPGGQSRREET